MMADRSMVKCKLVASGAAYLGLVSDEESAVKFPAWSGTADDLVKWLGPGWSVVPFPDDEDDAA